MPDSAQQSSPQGLDPSQWVDQHGDALYRYALLRTRDAELAEELVQECLVAALGAHGSFAGQSSERTWLIGILKRKVVDHVRRRAREQAHAEADEAAGAESVEGRFFDKSGLWAVSMPRWGSDPRKHVQHREFWDVFERCMHGLPSAQAEAFMLREMEQIDSQEICEVLGLTATNLWTRLHRARLALRACLESNWFRERKGRGGHPS